MFKIVALFALIAVALAYPEAGPVPKGNPAAAPIPEPKAKPQLVYTSPIVSAYSAGVPLAYSGGYVAPSVYSSGYLVG